VARFPIVLPPGLYLDGTNYQAKGRWVDANLTRWYGPGLGASLGLGGSPIGGTGATLGPVNGWRLRKSDATVLTGSPRAAITWKDNSANSWLGIGTHSKLYVTNILGTVFDITPTVGFTAGRATATATGGYGAGTYGSSTYGTPRPGSSAIVDATEWTLATWGEDLLAVSPDDGKLRQWDTSVGTGTVAATVTNSPACKAVCVTAERFVFALATDDPRTVSWCDQEANTVWTPSSTNQAGSFPLQTGGRLMCGLSVKGATLLFTDLDVHLAQYIGGTLVYGFDRVGNQCGAISRQAVAPFGNGEAAWMSQSGFWLWNGGGVVPLPCSVMDYIRQDINLLQKSKIIATVNSSVFEIEWRYCSGASTEIDRCVVWNYKDNWWTIGRAARTAGADVAGDFQYPILIDSTGHIYDHEVGWAYDSVSPYATSGPIELGNGDQIMHVLGLLPDDTTVGDVTASFVVRRNPDDVGVTKGPYTLTSKTDLRFSGGLLEMKITGSQMTNWRFGTPRLEVVPGEGR
jgi:hypothetical protein